MVENRSNYKMRIGAPGTNGCHVCAFRDMTNPAGCLLDDWECECLKSCKEAYYPPAQPSVKRLQHYIANLDEAVATLKPTAPREPAKHEPIQLDRNSLPERLRNKYVHPVWGYDPMTQSNMLVLVDYYDFAEGFNIDDPALDHACKKLVQPGARGVKTRLEDLLEAKQSLERAIEKEQMALNTPWEIV